MTAKEALELWETYGDCVSLPQLFRDMGLTRLRILVAEEARPPQKSAIDRMPIPPLGYNALDRALGREKPPVAPAPTKEAAPVLGVAEAPKTLRDRALTNPARQRTPARKRASFFYHLARCGFVAEAAARARVPRSTLYRWRDERPEFAARWDEAIALCRRAVGDDICLRAGHVEVQPIVYAGKKVGERRKVDTRMMIHVQNRMDVDRRRAEDRAERRELALLRAKPLDEAALAERLLELMEQRRVSRVPVSHVASEATADSASADKDLDRAA